jgi:hypothetical protein
VQTQRSGYGMRINTKVCMCDSFVSTARISVICLEVGRYRERYQDIHLFLTNGASNSPSGTDIQCRRSEAERVLPGFLMMLRSCILGRRHPKV